ncbi:MAG: DUF3859 domain-containing protein [Tabrizicola sp.]|jgi:hypothetical protein|nr:DUF3859 domain-containing protein [Tabrizicola sp.]
MQTLLRTLLVTGLLAFPAWADPKPPYSAPGIVLEGVGVYCQPGTSIREEAPGTTLGYIHRLSGTPQIAFQQQEVPARLGLHFGVIVRPDRTIAGVRAETWKPGATKPEVWYADLDADVPRARGFVFEFPDELVTGIWRMDAFEGDTLLYSVEWEVVAASELPGVTSDCTLLS